MKEESKKIKLILGNVSQDEELGIYYIDMRAAKIHYTNNIYEGGFDDHGVPFCGSGDAKFYFPINIAQFGFMLHADYLEKRDYKTLNQLKNCVEKLVELATIDYKECIWWHQHKELKYNINAPWASAMAQGEVISLFLRYYQITREEQYLELSKKAFHFLRNDVSEKGVRRYDNFGDLWFEEYPSNPSSYVLNGFIYTLFGLYDLYRVIGDKEVKEDIEACLKTLRNNLHRFDAGYWSYYDLLKKELVRFYYQKNVHVPQMTILYLLTQDPIFKYFAMRWDKQLTPWNYMLVRIMYRVLPRWRMKTLDLKKLN